jgi:hypothetical protein
MTGRPNVQHIFILEQMFCFSDIQQQQNPHVNKHEVNLKHINIVLIFKLMEGILFSKVSFQKFLNSCN